MIFSWYCMHNVSNLFSVAYIYIYICQYISGLNKICQLLYALSARLGSVEILSSHSLLKEPVRKTQGMYIYIYEKYCRNLENELPKRPGAQRMNPVPNQNYQVLYIYIYI